MRLGAGKFFWFVLYNQLSLTFFTFFGECCRQPLLSCSLTCMVWQAMACKHVRPLTFAFLGCRHGGCCADPQHEAGSRLLSLLLLSLQPVCR